MTNAQEIAAFGLDKGKTRGRTRSHSPVATPTQSSSGGPGNVPNLPPRAQSPSPSWNRGGTSGSGEGVLESHEPLRRLVQAFACGEINRARTLRQGGRYVDRLEGASEVERDCLMAEFSTILDRKDEPNEDPSRERNDRGEGGKDSGGQDGSGLPELDFPDSRASLGDVPEGVRHSLKLREDSFPWYGRKDETESRAESMRETREILDRIDVDFQTVKRWVRSAPGAPKHFPDSEWTNILRGKAVNLHHVLGGMFLLQPVSENVASVGGIEVRVPITNVSKRIETGIQWQAAWTTTVEAITFVFPHRRAELDRYGRSILAQFARKSPSAHARVILFDEAVREAVGGGEGCILTDTDIMEPFRDSILHPDGLEYQSGSQPGKRKGLCNRFNSKGGCRGANCQYLHKCWTCKDEGHGQSSCPNT